MPNLIEVSSKNVRREESDVKEGGKEGGGRRGLNLKDLTRTPFSVISINSARRILPMSPTWTILSIPKGGALCTK
jgi:hypothetical protein